MNERTPKEKLYWLINLYTTKEIEISNFCDEFSITYNQKLDYETLTEMEYALFGDLSKIVDRFSEFEEDHTKYPGVYLTNEDIDLKINKILEHLINHEE